jgi:hypothetical protein
MFEQPIVDTLIVIGMFVLRIGVPVVILYALAAWLGKKLQPQERQETQHHTIGVKVVPFPEPQRNNATTRASDNDTLKQANFR